MPTRLPADLWRDLVADAGEDEIDRAAAVSVAEAERALAAAGFDVAHERTKGPPPLVDTLRAPAPVASEDDVAEPGVWVRGAEPSRGRPASSRWLWVLAATMAAASTGGVLYALARRPKPIDKPVDVPSEAPSAKVPAPPAQPPSTAAPPGAPPGAPRPGDLKPGDLKPTSRQPTP
jgi:hypothetical protein